MEDTISELSKIFRNVTKLVKEKTEDYFGNLSALDRVLREINDEDTCSVPNSLLREIAKATNDLQSYHPIMHTVWTGIGAEPHQWRRIYKCLSLLEYSILLGPQRVFQDCRDGSVPVRTLTQFRYHDGLREQGGGVRQKATAIIKLIDEPGEIEAARQEALENCEKYVGIENKPAFDFTAGRFGNIGNNGSSSANPFANPPPGMTMSPSWAELGGAFRHPLPPNPYNSQNSFQTAEDAARTWGVDEFVSKQPPSLKQIRARYDHGYDAPSTGEKRLSGADNLPPDEEVFGSGPDWWSGETVAPNQNRDSSSGVQITNPPGAPPVMQVNLLDDDAQSPRPPPSITKPPTLPLSEVVGGGEVVQDLLDLDSPGGGKDAGKDEFFTQQAANDLWSI